MRSSPVKLGILDLCKRSGEKSPRQSLEETICLAELGEALGYSRFWVAEHHTEEATQACPEVLVGLIAARTQRIRVGAGGILLGYYSPCKVAEVFLVLEALFPGRIDLGVARGPGVTSTEYATSLVSGNRWELCGSGFEHKVCELTHVLREAHSPSTPGASVILPRPWGVPPPPVWILGSSGNSAKLAAVLGRPYGFALFFGGTEGNEPPVLQEYRTGFVPSQEHTQPLACVAVSIVCQESSASAHKWNEDLVSRGYFRSNIIGNPRECAERLCQIASTFEVPELILTTWIDKPGERRELFELIAETFRLRD